MIPITCTNYITIKSDAKNKFTSKINKQQTSNAKQIVYHPLKLQKTLVFHL